MKRLAGRSTVSLFWNGALIVLFAVFLPGGVCWSAENQEQSNGSYLMGQVVVTATKTPHTIKDTPVETVVVTRSDIAKTNAQNTVDVLKTIPGISVSAHDDTFGTYTWRATMRGLNFNDGYVLVLIDGQRVMGSGQSGGMGEYGIGLNQIPVEMIERVEVVKGPGSALYGSDAMAGVINIITRKVPEKQIAGAGVAYGWYTVEERIRSGAVQEPSDKHRNQSQAYVYIGDRPVENVGYLLQYGNESAQDVGSSRIDSERHSLMVKVDADLTNQLTFFTKGEVSDYEKQDNREEDSHRLSTGVEWRPGSAHHLSLKGYTYNWDFNHGFVDNTYGHKYGDIAYHQGEGQYTWQVNETHGLTIGAEFQRQCIDYLIDNSDGSRVTVDKDIDTSSLYLQDEIALFAGKIELVPGIRYDDHSIFGDEVNPKISAMYRFSEATTLRASVGRSFKSPTIRQLYYDVPYHHGSFYAQSNSDLKPETAIGYAIGVEQWLMQGRAVFSAGYFRNDVDKLVIREDTGTLYNGLPLLVYRNVQEAMIQGVEFMLKLWPNVGVSLDLAYTYTDSENEENQKNLTYTPEHQISLVPSYELKDSGLGVSANISYHSKQYTNTDNTAQIDDHTVVDAKIYKKLGSSAKLSFEVDNVFGSDKGVEGNYRTGQTFVVKLDMAF